MGVKIMQGTTAARRTSLGHTLLAAMRRTTRRLLRWLGLERNPLRRPTDRVEARIRITVVLACLAALPAVGAVGVAVHRDLTDAAARQAAALTRVSATVVEEPRHPGSRAAGLARVTWTAATGEHRTTTVVPADVHRGDRITVWTNPDGNATAPPLSRAGALTGALLAVAVLTVVVVLAGWLTLWLTRLLLDRRRYRDWAAEWSELGTRGRR
jgi:hypothetical protein